MAVLRVRIDSLPLVEVEVVVMFVVNQFVAAILIMELAPSRCALSWLSSG